MKMNQGDIAKIYGYNWEELVEANREDKMAYLRGKLDQLNESVDYRGFYGNLDLSNQRAFKAVIKEKLAFILEGGE